MLSLLPNCRRDEDAMRHRQVIERYVQATREGDVDAEVSLLHPEYIGRYPQSGEIIRGPENYRAIAERYPGRTEHALTISAETVSGTDDEYVTRPSWPAWTVVHLVGSDNEFTLSGRINYPNGEVWHVVAFLTAKDGKIWRQTSYFAAPFEAPDWRRPFVELEVPESAPPAS